MTKVIQKKQDGNRILPAMGILVGPFILAILLFFSFLVHNESFQDVGITAIIGISGVILGWGIGFLLSPHTAKPKLKVDGVFRSILIFVAGYLTAKLAPAIFDENIFFKEPNYGIRFLVFIICLVISTLNMYLYRKHLDELVEMIFDDEEEEITEPKKPAPKSRTTPVPKPKPVTK